MRNLCGISRLPPQLLHTVAPVVPVRPGGIGLDDLKGLLTPRTQVVQEPTDGTESSPIIGEGEKVVDANISKAGMSSTLPPSGPPRLMSLQPSRCIRTESR